MEELETIVITFDDDTEEEMVVLETTKLGGIQYYLVSPAADFENDEEEGECFILKEIINESDDEYGTYEFVEDEDELNCVFPIFEELLEESDTEVEF
ncbi:MAG: DUF1292 domain-containing protein [Lachnospiraceae bacterium]|nr:DUF1292 domain-containing protein [Lachnospiraceae bacterium]